MKVDALDDIMKVYAHLKTAVIEGQLDDDGSGGWFNHLHSMGF